MSAERSFLGFSALLWLGYGIFCFFQPGFLMQAAGVSATSATATTELRAMYGGLEAGIGALAALALVRPSLRRPALLTLLFLCAGLGSTRLLGVALDDSLSSYTAGGLALEWGTVAVSGWLLARPGVAQTA